MFGMSGSSKHKFFHTSDWLLLVNAAIVLALNTQQVNASVFSPVEQERYVNAHSQVWYDSPMSGSYYELYNDDKNANNFDSFNATATVLADAVGFTIGATQNSTIAETSLSVSYSTVLWIDSPNSGNAKSSYKVVFDLDTSTQVHLLGYINGFGCTDIVSLTGSTGESVFEFRSLTSGDDYNLDSLYLIGPGRYTFWVRDDSFQTYAMGSFGNVSLEIVPEPATMLLLGIGGIVLRRRNS